MHVFWHFLSSCSAKRFVEKLHISIKLILKLSDGQNTNCEASVFFFLNNNSLSVISTKMQKMCILVVGKLLCTVRWLQKLVQKIAQILVLRCSALSQSFPGQRWVNYVFCVILNNAAPQLAHFFFFLNFNNSFYSALFRCPGQPLVKNISLRISRSLTIFWIKGWFLWNTTLKRFF